MIVTKPSCGSCPVRSESVFHDLARRDLRDLAQSRAVNACRKGFVVFRAGTPAQGVYCLHSGVVKLFALGFHGRRHVVRLAGPGDLLGHRALLAGEPHATTAEVVEDAVLCFFDQAAVLRLLLRIPALRLRLLQRTCRDLRAAEHRSIAVTRRLVPERLAGLLVDLQRAFGETAPDGIRLTLGLTREDMAGMIGTTTESLIRALSDLRARGLVKAEAGRLTIRAPGALAQLVSPATAIVPNPTPARPAASRTSARPACPERSCCRRGG